MDDRDSERRGAAGIVIWGNRRESRVPNAPADGQCLTEQFRRGHEDLIWGFLVPARGGFSCSSFNYNSFSKYYTLLLKHSDAVLMHPCHFTGLVKLHQCHQYLVFFLTHLTCQAFTSKTEQTWAC